MPLTWDDTLKRLFAVNAADFVKWLMPGAELVEKAPLELKTTTKTRHADVLCKITVDGERALLHIEFQKRADSQMGERVWEYNVLATLEYGCPVYSFVIYLRPTSEVAEPFLEWGLARFGKVHRFRFTNIKLWELRIADLRQTELKGLLPLCLLAQDGEQHEVAEEVFAALKNEKELLALALTLASMVFVRPGDQSWLERQELMLEEIITDTWFYKHILKKGLDQGIQKGLKEGRQKGLKEGLKEGRQEGRQEAEAEMVQEARQMVLNAVEIRFPDLKDLAQKQVEQIQDRHAALQLIGKLLAAQTHEDAETILLNN